VALGVYFALVLLLVAGMLVVSYLLGQRHLDVARFGAEVLPGGDVHRCSTWAGPDGLPIML
jgi:hypothetical protein